MAFERTDFDTFLTKLKFPPNTFQLKVLESIAFGSGNIVVSALAGSGKTSLLVQTASLLGAMGQTSATYLAFNKSIRDELNERLPKGYSAINSHSLGLRILKGEQSKSRVDYKKWRELTRDMAENVMHSEDAYRASRSLEALCSKVMLSNTNYTDTEAIIQIALHYGIDGVVDTDTKQVNMAIVRAVKPTIEKAITIWRDTGAINFDEMIYLPVHLNLQPPMFDWVFVDESQDLNILQQEIAFRSCSANGRMVFVGDSRQAIYGFAGADAASFERIIEKTQAAVLPLNICYRCPKTHIALAQSLVPDIEAAPAAEEGIIRYEKEENLPALVEPGNLVMCRLNAPLLSAYFALIGKKIAAKILGKDIGETLIRTLDKVAELEGFTYDEAIKYLDRYSEMQTRVLMQREGNETKIEALHDQIECLVVCVENFHCDSLDCLKADLRGLFGDEGENWRDVVALCTVHKAKGLEADNTFLLRPEKMPLTWPGQQPWEFQQELNIKYVALTRAKHSLTILGTAADMQTVTPPPAPEAPAVAAEVVKPEEAPVTAIEVTAIEPAEERVPAAPVVIIPVPPAPRDMKLSTLVEKLSLDEIDMLIALLQRERERKVAVV